MPKRIPIKAASDLAKKHGLKQVILVAMDTDGREHVVTYGSNKVDCAQAAQGGNFVKKALGWPEDKCGDLPARIKLLEKKAKERDTLYAAACRQVRQAGALIAHVSIGGLLDALWPMVPIATLDGSLDKPLLDVDLKKKLEQVAKEADRIDAQEHDSARV